MQSHGPNPALRGSYPELAAVAPRHPPASDTLVHPTGCSRAASYGPRVESDGVIEPPLDGQDAEFYGVYRWCVDFKQWVWIADCISERMARRTASSYVNGEYTA